MTTDVAQENFAARKAGKSVELTRDDGFLNGRHDIFDVLARHDLEKDGLQRSIGAAVALLKKAQETIEQAEEKIAVQDLRIRTLEELTTTDELTGLHNRRGFLNAFSREIARIKRGYGNGGILVLVEIDSFESTRRAFGSEASDACVALVARILAGEVRAMDMVARLKKDAFVLLLSGTAAYDALERAQKLALRLNNLSLIRDKQEIQISASIGLKAYGASDKAEAFLSEENAETARAM
jgi:diguanylate cyclase (GGDEF)-like protein